MLTAEYSIVIGIKTPRYLGVFAELKRLSSQSRDWSLSVGCAGRMRGQPGSPRKWQEAAPRDTSRQGRATRSGSQGVVKEAATEDVLESIAAADSRPVAAAEAACAGHAGLDTRLVERF